MSRCVECGIDGAQGQPCKYNANGHQTMDLPAAKTCGDCYAVKHCIRMYGVEPTNTTCDFYPIRFAEPRSTVVGPEDRKR